MSRTIAVVQPYLATYQLPFFELSREQLLGHGISLEILAGSPPLPRRQRGDQAELDYCHDIPVVRTTSGALKFDYQASWLSKCSTRPDGVILEQATRHLDTYVHLLRSRFRGPAIAFWGHGRAFHREESQFLRRWRSGMTNSGSWFFAYTKEGAVSVANSGFPRDRISILNNATDTRSLRSAIASFSSETRRAFMETYGLSTPNTAIFIGGIDENKDIRTLIETCRLLTRSNSNFRCIVVGAGRLQDLVTSQDAIDCGIRYLGRLEGQQKALALAVSDVVLIPREVGLVAVDALAAGIPLLTQANAGHGPEFSYLIENSSVFTSVAGAENLALMVSKVLLQQGSDQRTMIESRPPIDDITIEHMSANFTDGVMLWMSLFRK
jgi:glycosyltransferase involved in cell wall biosynthesis